MSALIDDVPVVDLPPQARRRADLRVVAFVGAPVEVTPYRPAPVAPERVPAPVRARPTGRLADRADLQRPATRRPVVDAPALRLTSRGLVVLAAAIAVLAAALVGFAWLSAPASAGRTPVSTVVGNTVAVAPGDSLWSIATRVAPNRDPRAEVAELQQLNHLSGSALVPGQVLRVH